ncbi:MAG: Ig-like domain-containing protein [Pseudomonas piscis]|uniref:Ig-like domain-containing protein n=1 Tax=Pseudomonas piscis TaxID=2614538 RepID=UPI003D26D4D4
MTDMCKAQHCSGVSTQINNTCKANGWPVNHLVLVCDSTGACCNCTCSCLAFDTPVRQSATQTKSIQTFVVGDPVLAYDPNGQSQVRDVAFSNGTTVTSVQPEMAYVSFLVGKDEITVTVTMNHTFLGADRKLIQAQMLRPGYQVMLANGTPTEVTRLEVKSYTGGVWNISTSIGQPTNLDGHLIDTDGILSGDFSVQLFYDELADQGLAVQRGTEPAVTTRAHDAVVNSHAASIKGVTLSARPKQDLAAFLASASKSAATSLRSAGAGAGGITLQGDHGFTLAIPSQAINQGFLTQIQAEEAQHSQQAHSIRDPQRAGYCLWLFKLFQAIYPNIHFILDASSREANAFSLQLNKDQYVLVQGGLVRADALQWQGLALVLGYLVSRFSDSQPVGPTGLLCKSVADYLAPSVLQSVFNPLYPSVIFDAINQVETFFGYIPTKADHPETGCHATDLDCRIETYRRAISFEPSPPCAGGPQPATLKLLYAVPGADIKAPVTLTFSDPLDQAEAQKIANYFLHPTAKVLSVVSPPGKPNTVNLTADLKPGITYTVTVSDLLSVGGNALNPQYVRAAFQSPPH